MSRFFFSGSRVKHGTDCAKAQGVNADCAKAQSGFTLIEVLVAVAILAIALGAIITGMGRFANNASYLKQKTIALWVAHNRLTEIELQQGWPSEGTSDGTVDVAGAKWKWLVEIKSTQDDRLRRIDIRVQQADKDANIVSLSSFISNAGRQ